MRDVRSPVLSEKIGSAESCLRSLVRLCPSLRDARMLYSTSDGSVDLPTHGRGDVVRSVCPLEMGEGPRIASSARRVVHRHLRLPRPPRADKGRTGECAQGKTVGRQEDRVLVEARGKLPVSRNKDGAIPESSRPKPRHEETGRVLLSSCSIARRLAVSCPDGSGRAMRPRPIVRKPSQPVSRPKEGYSRARCPSYVRLETGSADDLHRDRTKESRVNGASESNRAGSHVVAGVGWDRGRRFVLFESPSLHDPVATHEDAAQRRKSGREATRRAGVPVAETTSE